MNREEKKVVIDSLAEKLTAYAHYYITDTSELNAEQTAALRKLCFEKEVKLVVAKNTLFIKALEQTGKINEEVLPSLKGETAIMFANAACVEDCIYLGDAAVEELVNIKSREELIGDIIGLLQSPAKNVISALQGSAGQKIAGLVKTLEARG